MEKSFDFGALLRNNEKKRPEAKKHKDKPIQFVSVAGGVQKRLQCNIKIRRSSRLTIFDQIRNLPSSASPDPVSEAQLKVEHRRQQLEKWKQDKEQKKREAAATKKKPFVAGVPHNPLKFVPPPPLPKPSSSGRVTRSQTAKQPNIPKTSPKRTAKSFAPKNASFKPPEIKNLMKLPSLAPLSKTKKKVFAFEPVLPNTIKQTRTRTTVRKTETKPSQRKPIENRKTETKPTQRKPMENRSVLTVQANTRKINLKTRVTQIIQSSSSSSDMESYRIVNRIKTPGPGKSTKTVKTLTPKVLALSSNENSSSSSEKSKLKQTRKSLTSTTESLSSNSCELSSDTEVSEKNTVTVQKSIKSVQNMSIHSSEESSSNDSYKTPIKRIPKSESSSEEKLRSPKSPIELPLTPEQMETAKKISPCVTLSRGKDNARKEMKWKIDEGMLDDDTSDIESVDHFRRQLASEIKRMTEMCEEWDKIAEQTVLPELVQEAILAAVGQARLLMNQKMQQFASLVERCARPDPASALVTPADLLGFWDMVFMQVENVDMRFRKLEEMRARDWADEAPAPAAARLPAAATAAAAATRRTRPAASSRIKDMIAAARRAKKQQPSPMRVAGTKTFEAGFFSVHSPVRSPASPAVARTPNNLLKAVLSSEANKSASRKSASFAMLRASVLGRNIDCDGIAPLQQTPQMAPVNLYATPGRSILKSANVKTKSANKSIKLVLFNESDNELDNSILLDLEKESNKNPKDVDMHTDELSMDEEIPEQKEKENVTKPKLVRQDAVEGSLVMTRSRRKSMQAHKEIDDIKETSITPRESNAGKTPRRTTRRKKSIQEPEIKEKTPKKSSRNKALQEVESNVMEEIKPTPKRSNRRRKNASIVDQMT